MSLTDDKRRELLAKISDGHDPQSAADALGIPTDQITAGGDGLRDAITEAFRVGTARLRAKVLDGALDQSNSAILLKLLEQREQQQASASETTIDITDPAVRHDWARRQIYMIAQWVHDDPDRDEFLARILQARCRHCGKQPYESRPPININVMPSVTPIRIPT